MNGKKISFVRGQKATSKITTSQVETKNNNNLGHHVTLVNANANSLQNSLGLTGDRLTELEKDIVEACKAALAGRNDALTLAQVIAIASQHCQSDNELVFAASLISEAYARGMDFAGLEAASEQELGLKSDKSDENVEAKSDDNEDQDAGFEAFMASMMAGIGGESSFAEGEDDDQFAEDAE